MPRAFPRCSGRHVSAMSAAAAVHSPPIPMPNKNRNAAHSVMECENPHAALATEYNPMDAISARGRSIQPAPQPNTSPPMAEATSVRELRKPAVRVSIANSRMRNAITREYNITSMASSIQPRPPAISVWRSAAVVSCGQLNRREDAEGFAEETLAEVSASAIGLNSCQKRPSPTIALLLIAQHRKALCRYDKSLR